MTSIAAPFDPGIFLNPPDSEPGEADKPTVTGTNRGEPVATDGVDVATASTAETETGGFLAEFDTTRDKLALAGIALFLLIALSATN